MRVERGHVLCIVSELRTFFTQVGLDATRYSDTELADAVVAVAPVVDDSWLNDEQVQRVFQRLAGDTQ